MGNLHETQELSLAGMSCREVGRFLPVLGGDMGCPGFAALAPFPLDPFWRAV